MELTTTHVYGLHAYGKIYNLGHICLEKLFSGPVVVEEKVDGSQFSFGVKNGRLFMRSKGAAVLPETINGLFAPSARTVQDLFEAGKLVEGWTYRGEAMCRPKHNTLEYGRAPRGNIALFDVDTGEERYVTRADKERIAENLGVEVVPVLYQGEVTSSSQLAELMERESFLGGCKIEGFVVKNYAHLDPKMLKLLMGKHVSEAFKEANGVDFAKRYPTATDFVDQLAGAYRTDARWQKAVQRLHESGAATNEPKDIGPLIKSVRDDIAEECEEEIKNRLWAHFKDQIFRTATRGLPEWYKGKLMELQFTTSTPVDAE